MGLQNSAEKSKTVPQQPQKPCGSIIDAQGREVDITPEMIRKACEDLEKQVVKPADKK
ncbi:PA1571 family protein [Pseudomonas sp. R5(2019)]|uniref:PA1571 family protein n=1 Tax=Pseudomonas sp. R5(2019) TaxID=2697566 RepID=UPI0014120E33|nr:PA1571 family protein [Pseudomonas sp. R5(2019)]